MQTLRFILSADGFYLQKDIQVSSSTPTPGMRMMFNKSKKGGYVFAVVKFNEGYPEENITKVWCEADLRAICLLVINEMGWSMSKKEEFESNPKVLKMMQKIREEIEQAQKDG